MVESASTKWIVFKNGQPLIASQTDRSLAQLSTAEVRTLLGSEPYFSQGQHDGESAKSDAHVLETSRFRGPGIVFLGLHETDPEQSGALPSSDFSAKQDAAAVVAKIKGTAYFALDVSDVDEKQLDEVLQSAGVSKTGGTFSFVDGRQAMSYMDYFVGGIYASARALVDWNARNKVRIQLHKLRLCSIPSLPSSVRPAVRLCIRCGRAGNWRAPLYFHGRITLDESRVPQRMSRFRTCNLPC